MTQGFATMPNRFSIAPETSDSVDYNAFKETASSLFTLPQLIADRLQDDSSVENRKTALTTIHHSIQNCDKSEIAEHLQNIVILVTMPMSDSNIKIVLTALQVLDDLVGKVKNKISPHLDQILTVYLERVACSKYNVKQAGIKLLLHLIEVVGSTKVLIGIMDHGYSSKKSKIREESLNVISIALLHFPAGTIDLKAIVTKTAPLLIDSRQNVRQACFEACTVLSKQLGQDDLQLIVSAVSSVEQTLQKPEDTCTYKPTLMRAFEARIARSTALPSINKDGLLEHAIKVANGKGDGVTFSGPDVDWILAGTGKNSSSPGVSGRKISTSGSGPLRSAGKKLPWDPAKEENPHKILDSTHSQYSSYSTRYQQSYSKPSPAIKHRGYLDIHQNRSMMRSSISTDKPFNYASHDLNDSFHRDNGLHNGLDISSGEADLFATTWPRSNGYYSSFMKATSRQISADAASIGGPQSSQSKTTYTCSTLPAIGSRPPSKPLVRNLFPPPVPSIGEPQVPSILPSTVGPRKNLRRIPIEEEDQEYYNIPEDDLYMNASLTSSVSSLCGLKDGQTAGGKKKNGNTAVDTAGQPHVRKTKYSTTASPVGTPPLMSGPSPQKGVKIISTAPNTTKRNVQEKKQVTSPPKLNGYSKQHKTTASTDNSIETVLNATFTFSPPENRSSTMAKEFMSNKPPPHTSTKNKTYSYAEAASLRKSTKLLSSPEHEPYSKKPPPLNLHTHNFGGSYASDMESTHDYSRNVTSQPNPPAPSIVRKTKKLSPSKNVITPLKASRQSLTPINGACSSAPVYRTAPDSVYIQDDSLVELEPHPNPELAVKEFFEDLESGSEEWERKCKGLLIIRRLAAYNKEVLAGQLQQVVRVVNQEVKNLRSQVARGAIACLGDMFAFLGRDMEQPLDMIVKTLLQAGSKANTFLREDAEKAMREMIAWINPSKCTCSLLNGGLSHGNSIIRRLMVQSLWAMVEHHGTDKMLKQLPQDVLVKLLNAVIGLLTDADAGARYYAKKCVYEFCGHPEFERIAGKCLPKPQFVKLKEAMETLRLKGVGKLPPELHSAKQSVNGGHYGNRSVTAPSTGPSPPTKLEVNYSFKSTTRKRRGSSSISDNAVSPVEFPLPDGLLGKMSANDWNTRNQAITELENFILIHPSGLGSNITKVFDTFNQRLTDQNSKVNLNALQSFERFIPLIGSQIHPVLSTLMEALVRTVASRYPTIHSAAVNAMEALIGSVDHTILISSLSSAAQNANARVQPFMLRKLAEILPGIHQQKPAQVIRVGLPVLWKVLSSRSPATGEAKAALQCLCESLFVCIGPEKLESCMLQQPPDQQQKLRDILRNLQLCF